MGEPTKKDWLYYNRCGDKIFASVEDIEREAGVYERAAQIRSGPMFRIPTPILNDTPIESERWAIEAAEDEREESAYIDSQLRHIYFSIPDINKRREIMYKWRDFEENKRLGAQAALREEQNRVREAQVSSNSWLWSVGLTCIGLTFFGHSMFQVPGAIAGAALALLFGQAAQEEARNWRNAAVKSAEADLASQAETTRIVMNQRSLFTQSEITSGNPDQN